jgi:hypothetical protein
LKKKISSENVVKRLILAFLYNDAEFKEVVLNHVMDNENAINLSSIKDSQEWIELGNKNPKVAGEIWNAISKKINS